MRLAGKGRSGLVVALSTKLTARIGLILAAMLIAAATVVPSVAAQEAVPGARKQAMATRVPLDSIRVDGRLDESVWALATPIADFVQKEPVEGVPPTEYTEIRFVYDDDALYIGARMDSGLGPSGIQAPLSRRDSGTQLAEYILISLDTYLDRRTAYSFGVTASGVRLDHYHASDTEGRIDPRFDPVWEAAVSVNGQGWTAEMWIPFTQLRFTEGQEQVWGLNMQRWIPSKNEADYWVAVPRTENFWASRFGDLRGIRAIDQSKRIELLPYVTGGSTLRSDSDSADPFTDALNLEGRVGADFKMGVGPNLTLDATVTPDFGQVEVDPAVVNLTDTEVFFPERRPFFTEGSDLLNGPDNNYFYSRRIGARPRGRAVGDFVDYPDGATILGAAKLTGRLASGTSVGVLGAVTGAERAQTFDLASATFDGVRVAPRTLYGVGRVQQEFGASGSTVSLMATGVQRDLKTGDPLAALLRHRALMVGGSTLLRLGGGAYEVSVSGGLTRIEGDPEVILQAQLGSERYFQRPDATHVEVDSSRVSMVGGKATFAARKVTGTHWLWDTNLDFESPEVTFNDVGRLGTGDGIMLRTGGTYRETQPGELFRGYRLQLSQSSEWNYGGERQFTRLDSNSFVTWNNFWTTQVIVQVGTRALSHRLTRGGPSIGTERTWSAAMRLQNSSASRTRWNASFQYGGDG